MVDSLDQIIRSTDDPGAGGGHSVDHFVVREVGWEPAPKRAHEVFALPARGALAAIVKRLLATLGQVDRNDQSPIFAVHRFAMFGALLFGDRPLCRQVDRAAQTGDDP